ncbi:MAG: gluconate 2-dehydrogenase subunit 3 family protein [Alphaproteobacteria bacterium]|nr:gluconate 2-dehydrogenase subunit 3 family protein [Alphaproteobacteria bacterium]
MSEVSRRVTLTWFAAASSGALALEGCASPAAPSPAPVPPPAVPVSLWKDLTPALITAPGYGYDPNLNKPVIPWPLTLEPGQRETLRIAADLVLPADAHSPSGSALHLDAFLDEWVSAPYPLQQADRRLILSGLAWLDAESQQRFGKNFAQANDAQRREIFDLVAYRRKVQPGYQRPAQFFVRLRGLMLAGFYSQPEGIADIGYKGNNPTPGPYPGPTPEAMAHLNAALTRLGLKPVKAG